MGEFIKQLRVDNNERITALKFINYSPQVQNQMGMSHSSDRSAGNSSSGSSLKNQHLLIAHSDKISIFSAKDNFNKRHTFRINSTFNSGEFGAKQFGFDHMQLDNGRP